MRSAAFVLALAAIPSLAQAQSPDTPVISGIVREFGGDGSVLPVSGAQVTLSGALELVATVYTDSTGMFEFQNQPPGLYLITVKKDGYGGDFQHQTSATLAVTVSPGESAMKQSFYLSRHGALTGRVIDEDGTPVADLTVTIQGKAKYLEATAVTGSDGTFTATDLRPGPYVVRISPRSADLEKLIPQFAADDLKTVDGDLETTYWPGGFPEPSVRILVNPGASANAGTITIRSAPYYRVHVSVPRVDCAPGEEWTFMLIDHNGTALDSGNLPCTQDFLVRNLSPGSYWFLLRKDEPDPGRWALTSVDISTKNLDVALTLEPEGEIVGRFIAADGATLPPLENIVVSSNPVVVGFAAGGAVVARPDAEGKFVLKNLKFPRHQILVTGLPKQYYVKGFHFSGDPSDGVVAVGPGAAQKLEIVIDDKPGTITGTVADGDKPAAQSLVMLFTSSLQPAQAPVFAGSQGSFQFTGVAPGQYRAIAVPLLPSKPEDIAAVTQLAARAETIAVERGGSQTVSLRLSNPAK